METNKIIDIVGDEGTVLSEKELSLIQNLSEEDIISALNQGKSYEENKHLAEYEKEVRLADIGAENYLKLETWPIALLFEGDTEGLIIFKLYLKHIKGEEGITIDTDTKDLQKIRNQYMQKTDLGDTDYYDIDGTQVIDGYVKHTFNDLLGKNSSLLKLEPYQQMNIQSNIINIVNSQLGTVRISMIQIQAEHPDLSAEQTIFMLYERISDNLNGLKNVFVSLNFYEEYSNNPEKFTNDFHKEIKEKTKIARTGRGEIKWEYISDERIQSAVEQKLLGIKEGLLDRDVGKDGEIPNTIIGERSWHDITDSYLRDSLDEIIIESNKDEVPEVKILNEQQQQVYSEAMLAYCIATGIVSLPGVSLLALPLDAGDALSDTDTMINFLRSCGIIDQNIYLENHLLDNVVASLSMGLSLVGLKFLATSGKLGNLGGKIGDMSPEQVSKITDKVMGAFKDSPPQTKPSKQVDAPTFKEKSVDSNTVETLELLSKLKSLSGNKNEVITQVLTLFQSSKLHSPEKKQIIDVLETQGILSLNTKNRSHYNDEGMINYSEVVSQLTLHLKVLENLPSETLIQINALKANLKPLINETNGWKIYNFSKSDLAEIKKARVQTRQLGDNDLTRQLSEVEDSLIKTYLNHLSKNKNGDSQIPEIENDVIFQQRLGAHRRRNNEVNELVREATLDANPMSYTPVPFSNSGLTHSKRIDFDKSMQSNTKGIDIFTDIDGNEFVQLGVDKQTWDMGLASTLIRGAGINSSTLVKHGDNYYSQIVDVSKLDPSQARDIQSDRLILEFLFGDKDHNLSKVHGSSGGTTEYKNLMVRGDINDVNSKIKHNFFDFDEIDIFAEPKRKISPEDLQTALGNKDYLTDKLQRIKGLLDDDATFSSIVSKFVNPETIASDPDIIIDGRAILQEKTNRLLSSINEGKAFHYNIGTLLKDFPGLDTNQKIHGLKEFSRFLREKDNPIILTEQTTILRSIENLGIDMKNGDYYTPSGESDVDKIVDGIDKLILDLESKLA